MTLFKSSILWATFLGKVLLVICLAQPVSAQIQNPGKVQIGAPYNADPNNRANLIVRPDGIRNNIGHYESGIYGNIMGNSKWIGIGSAPAGQFIPPSYGTRLQWDNAFAIFNLRQEDPSQRDAVIQWGGSLNNRLIFEFSETGFGPVRNYFTIESNGNIALGADNGTSGDVNVRAFALEHQGADFRLGTNDGRNIGVKTNQRALVHNFNNDDVLVVNYEGDFEGGVRIDGPLVFGPTYQTVSDQRLKQNVQPIEQALSKILQVKGVGYNYGGEQATTIGLDSKPTMGFIAQDLQKVFPELVRKSSSDLYSVNYDGMIPVLVEALKEQNQVIQQLRERVSQLEATKSQSSSLRTTNQEQSAKAVLFQNQPNPFSQITKIRVSIPATIQQAILLIYDMQGKQLRRKVIEGRGNVNYQLNASDLKPGMYMYTLIVDGKEADTKRMILTK